MQRNTVQDPAPLPDELPPESNLKSDVEAKQAFVQELIARGFESVKVTKLPADITATRNGQTYYYEIKYTTRTKLYFGAATLTEWEAALQYEDREHDSTIDRRTASPVARILSGARQFLVSYYWRASALKWRMIRRKFSHDSAFVGLLPGKQPD